MKNYSYDAVVVGSGPNGLAAAVCIAQAGFSVLVVEANETLGGGARSAELTLPGFVHDVCSAVHPLAVGSPFFQTLPLGKFGLEYIEPAAQLTHPLDDGTAILLKRSLDETIKSLGTDAANYRNLIEPFVQSWPDLAPEILAPLHFPKHLFLMVRLGWTALRSAQGFAEKYFEETRTRAVFAGCAAHSMTPLENMPSAAIGIVLAVTAHSLGWVFPRGGAQKITDALVGYLVSLGGEIKTNFRVDNVDDLPSLRAVLFDLTPRQILKIAGHRLPTSYKRRLENFRYGPGVFKMDFALSNPIPWRATECSLAGTVHLGGSFEEIATAEGKVGRGQISEQPFVLVAQSSLFDPIRAPVGKHTAWAYCHVPNGSTVDMSERIENQIERYAPGFRDCIMARSMVSPADLEKHNSNYIGGDIGGGANILSQLFTRPTLSFNPYSIPAKGLYICSASTPPGGGVHGMCGYHAAKAVLLKEFGRYD